MTSLPLARRAASRFVAGETSREALAVVAVLNRQGIQATLDHLGESTTSREEAMQASREILDLLDQIDQSGVRANISIKLSQIGLTIDRALCRELLFAILGKAKALGNFVRIDMEDSSLTRVTLELYLDALNHGFQDTGIVLQSYLYRTGADLDQVLAAGGRVRLCKGAYNEPDTVAFPHKKDVDEAYDRLAQRLLDETRQKNSPALSPDGRIPPIAALATHDPLRIQNARQAARERNLPSQAVEFQMLYGIRRDLQAQLAAAGYAVRVYVPYGTHWYPYFMRRLAERPANVWFILSNFFRN